MTRCSSAVARRSRRAAGSRDALGERVHLEQRQPQRASGSAPRARMRCRPRGSRPPCWRASASDAPRARPPAPAHASHARHSSSRAITAQRGSSRCERRIATLADDHQRGQPAGQRRRAAAGVPSGSARRRRAFLPSQPVALEPPVERAAREPERLRARRSRCRRGARAPSGSARARPRRASSARARQRRAPARAARGPPPRARARAP